MARAKHYAIYTAVGGGAYWAPDILVQWLRPPHRVWISLLTFGVPAVLGLSWFTLSKREPHRQHSVGLPLFMLLGIWALGPLGVAIGAVPAGGTFLEAAKLSDFLTLWLAFPMTTIMMATYSGSLGGLGVATLFLLIVAIVNSIRQRSNKSLQPTARSGG